MWGWETNGTHLCFCSFLCGRIVALVLLRRNGVSVNQETQLLDILLHYTCFLFVTTDLLFFGFSVLITTEDSTCSQCTLHVLFTNKTRKTSVTDPECSLTIQVYVKLRQSPPQVTVSLRTLLGWSPMLIIHSFAIWSLDIPSFKSNHCYCHIVCKLHKPNVVCKIQEP